MPNALDATMPGPRRVTSLRAGAVPPTAGTTSTTSTSASAAGRQARPADVALHDLLTFLADHGFVAAQVRAPGRDRFDVLEADVLVAPAQRAAIERHLARDGFRQRPGWGRRPHRFWLRPVFGDDLGVDWLKLDLVTDLCFGRWHEIVTATSDACLARRVDARLAPGDELCALLLHGLLDKGALRGPHRSRLSHLAAARPEPGPLAPICTVPGSPASSWEALLDLLELGEWDTVSELGPAVLHSPVVGRRWAVRLRRARNVTARRLSKVLTAVGGRGPVVALLGPDGTGKTTLADSLAASAGVPAVVLYGGTYRSGEATSPVPGADTARVVRRLLATRAAISRHRARGRLVILDRHPVQARPTDRDQISGRAALRRRILAATLRQPDLHLVLDAPAEELHRRRPEHTVAHLDRDRGRHLHLARSTPSAVVVDGSGSAEQVRVEALRRIWELAVPTRCR